MDPERSQHTTGRAAGLMANAFGLATQNVYSETQEYVAEESARIVAAWRRQGWDAWATEPAWRLRFGGWCWMATVSVARPTPVVA